MTFFLWRSDGWPYCPLCGEDELYSLAAQPTVETIAGCYRCNWSPSSTPEVITLWRCPSCRRITWESPTTDGNAWCGACGDIECEPFDRRDKHAWREAQRLRDTLARYGNQEHRLQVALALLLDEVEARASLVPGGTGHPYNTGDEFATWACWGPWCGGGDDVDTARASLRIAVERDLQERAQTEASCDIGETAKLTPRSETGA